MSRGFRAPTPTMGLAQAVYAIANNRYGESGSVPERDEAFDRMIAAHDVELLAQLNADIAKLSAEVATLRSALNDAECTLGRAGLL